MVLSRPHSPSPSHPDPRPLLGVVSHLVDLRDRDYLADLQHDQLSDWEALVLSRSSDVEVIIELFRISKLVVLSGSSSDVVMDAPQGIRVNWSNPFVRYGLVSLVYMLHSSRSGGEDFTQTHALFNCFSSQLLALALAILHFMEQRGLTFTMNTVMTDSQNSPLLKILNSPDFEIPIGILPQLERGVVRTNGDEWVFALHQQYIDPRRAVALNGYVTDRRKAQGIEIVEGFSINNWSARQSHPDYGPENRGRMLRATAHRASRTTSIPSGAPETPNTRQHFHDKVRLVVGGLSPPTV